MTVGDEAIKQISNETGRSGPSAGKRQLCRRSSALSLSTRLLLLTIAFVMLAEVLIFVPSMANFRKNWLMERLAAAQIASLAAEAAPENTVPDALREELLASAGVHGVALRRDEFRQLVLQVDTKRPVEALYDLREDGWFSLLKDGIAVFFSDPHRMIRVIGRPERSAGEFIEIVLDEAPLKAAMVRFALNILGLSIIISLITAALVYFALNALFVRPMKRITWSMLRFRENPEDRSRIAVPSGRGDELGMAEKELAAMQTDLADMLYQKSHLAALGLAVSKINHDLRNMLASAQLISDRMTSSPDPTVQRFAPKLIASLDRAIQLCTDTLNFGKMSEKPPSRSLFPVAPLIEEAAENLGLSEHALINFTLDAPQDLEIDADRDQLFRVLSNLLRNAVQILEQKPPNGRLPQITARAWREESATSIEISDNGPGVPAKVREHLFEAFTSSARDGGTGLGLVIASEIVRAHGGQLELIDTDHDGAVFRLSIPDRMASRPRRFLAGTQPHKSGNGSQMTVR